MEEIPKRKRGRPPKERNNILQEEIAPIEENQEESLQDPPIDPEPEMNTERRGTPFEEISTEEPNLPGISEPNEGIPKKKRGRPPKANKENKAQQENAQAEEEIESQDSDSEDDAEEAITQQEITPERNNFFSYLKEGLDGRKEDTLYFIDPEGKPLDEGAKLLFNCNKLSWKNSYEENTIHQFKVVQKIYFGLCPKPNESIILIKENLSKLFSNLKTIFINSKIKHICKAKSDSICNIPWEEIVDLIERNFEAQSIQFRICKNTLIHVISPAEKDKIFDECHNSLLAGHKGINKTYKRIKQTYHWENLWEDVTKRIQQCLP